MKSEELLDAFLRQFPNSAGPADEYRFLKYAFAAAREEAAFNRGAFERAGVEPRKIDVYETVYSYVRMYLDGLSRGDTF